jgi:hypothetical protein
MRVKNLIDLLQKEDPEMRVIIDGYEGGYDEVKKILHVEIIPNVGKKDAWWYGEFDYAVGNNNSEKALLFPRNS